MGPLISLKPMSVQMFLMYFNPNYFILEKLKSYQLQSRSPNIYFWRTYTQKEIDGFERLLKSGFVDCFRKLYPEKKGAYTYWSVMGDCRKRNIGWRIDYFIISQSLKSRLKSAFILDKVLGSDHCPVGIEIG